MLQTVQDKAIKGVQKVKNFIPGLEDVHFLSQSLPNDVSVKRLRELQEKFVGGEKNDQKLIKKRKARKTYALSEREKLAKTAKKMDDDGIMVKV